MYEKSVQQVEPEHAAFHLPSSSMCCDSCPSNSFLIRVTGQLSHSMCEGEERRGERTRFFITNRYLHVPHLHTVRKVISKDFLFFFFSTSPLTDWVTGRWMIRWEHTAALTAWRHARARRHVWVWTRAGVIAPCVPSAPPSAETLTGQNMSAQMMLSKLWPFCCSFIPATTGTLQTVESLAPG